MSIFGPFSSAGAASVAVANQGVRILSRSQRTRTKPNAGRRPIPITAQAWVFTSAATTSLRQFSSSAKGKQKAADEPDVMYGAAFSPSHSTQLSHIHVDTASEGVGSSAQAWRPLVEYRHRSDRIDDDRPSRVCVGDSRDIPPHTLTHHKSAGPSSSSSSSSSSSPSHVRPEHQSEQKQPYHPEQEPSSDCEQKQTSPHEQKCSNSATTSISISETLVEQSHADAIESKDSDLPLFGTPEAHKIHRHLRSLLQSDQLSSSALQDSITEYLEALPTRDKCNSHQAALLLINVILRSHIKSEDTPRGRPCDPLDLQLAIHLYESTLDGQDLWLHSPARDSLVRFSRKLLLSDSLGEVRKAAQILRDHRLKGTQVRLLFRESIQHLRRICLLSQQGRSGQEGERQRHRLLIAWRASIQSRLADGTLDIVKRANNAAIERPETLGKGSERPSGIIHTAEYVWGGDGHALGDFTTLLAEFGPGRSALELCEEIRDHLSSALGRLLIQPGKAKQGVMSQEIISKIPFLIPVQVSSILYILTQRGLLGQAAMVFSMVPIGYRIPRHYEILLGGFGEGQFRLETIGHDFDETGDENTKPVSILSRSKGKHVHYPPSFGFQDHLWTQALCHPRIRCDADRQVRLFSARMTSHATQGSFRMLMEDVKEMYKRELVMLPDEKSARKGRKGSEDEPVRIAVLVARAAVVLPQAGQRGVLKTLTGSGEWDLAGEVAAELGRLSHAKGSEARSHILNASTHLLLSDKHPPSDQVETYLSRMRYLVEDLGLPPDNVTRNTILNNLITTHLPSAQGPASGSAFKQVETIFTIFTKCGILTSSGTLSNRCELDPKGFLSTDTSILRSFANQLFRRGWKEQGKDVVGLLKEGEKVASLKLRESKERKKGEAKRKK
ncbi:unnamed protein product [Sympodiomycopsis kandeliae]